VSQERRRGPDQAPSATKTNHPGLSVAQSSQVDADAGVCRSGRVVRETGPAGSQHRRSSERNAPQTVPVGSDDPWLDAFTAALCWVTWTGRPRSPNAATNDLVWALSIADWWVGPGAGGRDG